MTLDNSNIETKLLLENDWRDLFLKLQNRKALSRKEVKIAWNNLWNEWIKIDSRIVKNKFLPWKLKMGLAMRKIDPRIIMIAPTFLVSLASKGLTKEELLGFMDSFKEHGWFQEYKNESLPFASTVYSNGFGGDAIKTINVSTSAMIIAAAAGAPVYKMGSRSYYSLSGAQDFITAIGVKPQKNSQKVTALLKKIKIAYIDGTVTADNKTQELAESMALLPFANQLMKAFFYTFRYPILLFNPLNAKRHQRGISTLETEVVAATLLEMYPDIELAQVIAGMDETGQVMDEISNVGPTKISEIRNGKIKTFMTSPEDWGTEKSTPEEIRGGRGPENARITIEIFSGQRKDAHRDILLVNASQLIYLSGITNNFKDGTELAKKALDSGKALAKLKEFIVESDGSLAKFEELCK